MRTSTPRADEWAILTTFFKSLLTALAGTALGLAVTYYVLGTGLSFDELRAGPWIRWPKTGTMEIDPYAHAMLARSGRLPLGAGEGLSFSARTDSDGKPLRGRCDYVIDSPVPEARYWTLTVYSPKGALVQNKAQRYGFTSAEILRAAGGSFQIAVARDARPGNWLPLGTASNFVLVLRLYDTLVDFGVSNVDANALPRIVRGHCA